ncbi:MAG TPA: NADP-dependent isocitrate dehydrogenase [Beutenbergiaceae bacterium]|nr:NADP-dependent isocitrate dehydrogenase [Beutenbergiaceae bacterium]
MEDASRRIIYTYTDEAPALATESLLPIIETFGSAAGVRVETRDISLAGRILGAFDDRLPESQRRGDALAELGELATTPEANIMKLPNISASTPQLKAAIAELQAQGFDLPDYPDEPSDDEGEQIKARYDAVKGSAVNPVLREGNSDRRAPAAVKAYARNHPHSMGEWSSDSRTHVATMDEGDFRSSEKSLTTSQATEVRIELVSENGAVTVLKESVPLQAGEIFDAAVMSRRALQEFLAAQVADAAEQDVLFSVHLKATMMKVSDPIIFGHAVRAYFRDLFDDHGEALAEYGINANDGVASLTAALTDLPPELAQTVRTAIDEAYESGPDLAMVDSDRGITNLHVPSDVIVDASMPAMIRSSGKMWNANDALQDAKAVIPDSSYAAVYAETIEHCRAHGAFDPRTMGSVPNVGLMAQKAEEYGSHDKTFEITESGVVRVVDADGTTLMEHPVQPGDIWRGCQTKDAPIQDWVKLAVNRARASSTPAVFWLDADRAHDAELIAKVERYLTEHDTDGLDISVLPPAQATRHTLLRAREGKDTISVTGNVLRDYLTDLFPILELGTSAKMLSIVPLINGGGLFETGAGGSAPKHVQQFTKENHLRWDSLGEFLALAASLEHLADVAGDERARVLAQTLDTATAGVLEEGRSPSRKVGELDNRGSHFYLASYWATALAEQSEDSQLAKIFAPLAAQLTEHTEAIEAELNEVQGNAVDIGGYYAPDRQKAAAAMRPSATFNRVLSDFTP